MTTLNPTCSEAVFRLGGELFEVDTSTISERELFVERLKRMDDGELDDYEPLENRGGGANFYALEYLIEARKQLGKEIFFRLPSDIVNEIDEGVIALVVGRERYYLPRSPEELFLVLLREGEEVEVAALRTEANKICQLFRGWKKGEMTREQFRAKALAILLLEAGRWR